MILVNFELQCVECSLCGEQTEVRPRKFYDLEHMMLLREGLAEDHKECEQWKHDPRRAGLERQYKVGMRRELARAERRRKAACS